MVSWQNQIVEVVSQQQLGWPLDCMLLPKPDSDELWQLLLEQGLEHQLSTNQTSNRNKLRQCSNCNFFNLYRRKADLHMHAWLYNENTHYNMKAETCDSLLPKRITEAASDAAFSFASICKAIPTSASAREGASFIPSPT